MQKQRYVNLRQFFLYIFEKIWFVFIVMLVLAVALGAYDISKQKKEGSNNVSDRIRLIQTASSQNREAYYNGGTYTDNELPAGMCNASARIYIDYSYDEIVEGTILDMSSVMNKVQADARILLVDDTAIQYVIDTLKLKEDADMKDLDTETLRWLINKNTIGSNIMQIVVTDVNEDRANRICQALIDFYKIQIETHPEILSVQVVDAPSIICSKLEPTKAKDVDVSYRGVLKYAIIGSIGGAFLAVVCLLLVYIIFDCVRNAEDADYTGTMLLEKVSRKADRYEEDVKKIAFQLFLLKKKRIVFIPVDSASVKLAETLTENVSGIYSGQDAMKEISVQSSKAIRKHADVILEAKASEAVVLVAAYGKTRTKDAIYAVDKLNEIDAKPVGMVII